MNQLFGLALNRLDYFRMTVSGRADGDSGIAVQKDVAVHVFNPNALSALRNELERRAGIGRVNELRIGFNDYLAFRAWQRGLD
jgi:hypothetical protein